MKAKIYGPFSPRENLTQEETALATARGVKFIGDPQGNDWYQLVNKFSADTLKIIFDDSGIIRMASYDASTLWAEGQSVAEVDVIPAGFDSEILRERWVFDGKKISERVYTASELMEQATATREELQAEAALQIAPLQDAVDIDEATDKERANLTAWKKYRVALNRLDLSAAPDINWPEAPQ
ncbi:tail fiber assembly protein [Rahnella aceris]|uniref:tail fiber assembly protein n=1 Tax=Rahnella sp. (strain Y9602) TaxID=2703885 RepID=UPI001C27747A|nr:tail fiber assembly protein [Rahnella aceris]MBU9852778.1 tail fiber assembly protein [Rahnella aceris]